MKKHIVSLFLIISLLTLSACSAANSTVNSLFKGLQKYDTEAMTKCLTDFPAISREQLTYDLFSSEDYVALFQKTYQDIRYDITETQEKEAEATVTVKVKHPDFSSAYATAMYTVASQIFADENLYNLVQQEDADLTGLIPRQMITMYENQQIESIETTYTLTLQKIDGQWKITDDDNLRNLISCGLYQNVKSTIDSASSIE